MLAEYYYIGSSVCDPHEIFQGASLLDGTRELKSTNTPVLVDGPDCFCCALRLAFPTSAHIPHSVPRRHAVHGPWVAGKGHRPPSGNPATTYSSESDIDAIYHFRVQLHRARAPDSASNPIRRKGSFDSIVCSCPVERISTLFRGHYQPPSSFPRRKRTHLYGS